MSSTHAQTSHISIIFEVYVFWMRMFSNACSQWKMHSGSLFPPVPHELQDSCWVMGSLKLSKFSEFRRCWRPLDSLLIFSFEQYFHDFLVHVSIQNGLYGMIPWSTPKFSRHWSGILGIFCYRSFFPQFTDVKLSIFYISASNYSWDSALSDARWYCLRDLAGSFSSIFYFLICSVAIEICNAAYSKVHESKFVRKTTEVYCCIFKRS